LASNAQDNVNLAQGVPTVGVGHSLKTARELTGKTVAEVAHQLRIRQPFLQALEDGRHKDLPGGTYAVGFLRTYAEFLGLDGEEMVRRFRSEAAGDLDARLELVFPSPVSEGRIPGGAVLFLGLVFAGMAYGGWYWLSSRQAQVAEMVPPLPDRLASVFNRQATVTGETAKPAEAPKPDETPAKHEEPAPQPPAMASKDGDVVPPAEAEDEPKAATPAAAVTEPAAPKAEMAPKVEAAKVETAEPTVAAQEGKVIGQDHADSRILLKAIGDDCWVQVRELDGQLLLSRLLRRGDSYMVPNRPGLTLMVGNAGALDILVDGKKAPNLGNAGQVRRDIKLDADKLLGGG
jgi:cytoskeleton protein RodZ